MMCGYSETLADNCSITAQLLVSSLLNSQQRGGRENSGREIVWSWAIHFN